MSWVTLINYGVETGYLNIIVIIYLTLKMLTKYTLCFKIFSQIKTYPKEHNNRQNVNICIRNFDTNKEREKAIESV
jgi:hypothetical protein